MKIQVLRSSKGKIIATFEQKPGELVSLEPDKGRGETLGEVDVPDDYVNMPPVNFFKKLETDIKSKQLNIKLKK